ncbi:hypothetical protein, partial [Flavobacterium sp.]|uniref:hypothetical protein n=1 Tax=Flavobacterium sp. TaxID=239 RepID=UPI00404B23E8
PRGTDRPSVSLGETPRAVLGTSLHKSLNLLKDLFFFSGSPQVKKKKKDKGAYDEYIRICIL